MKLALSISLMLFMTTNFYNCSSAQKLQKETPFTVDNCYFQKWVAGVKDGGSGSNLFIILKEEIPDHIKLDSVYFMEKVSKLQVQSDNPKIYVGRFKSEINQKRDVIMSNDPNAEYGNELPFKKQTIPFELGDNECVISYSENNQIKYFKIENVVEKQALYYPSAPPKK